MYPWIYIERSSDALEETHMEPENHWFVEEASLPKIHVQVPCESSSPLAPLVSSPVEGEAGDEEREATCGDPWGLLPLNSAQCAGLLPRNHDQTPCLPSVVGAQGKDQKAMAMGLEGCGHGAFCQMGNGPGEPCQVLESF